MDKRKERQRARRIRYWQRTWRNKVYALALLFIGTVSMMIGHDGTLLIITALFAIPMFFSRENWIM